MKGYTIRITALILALILALPLISCGKDDENSKPDPIKAYKNALSVTPSRAEAESSLTASVGRLEGSYAVTYTEDGVSVSYTRKTFSSIDSGTSADELINIDTDDVVIQQGASDGKLGVLITAIITKGILLDGITDYIINGDTLTFTVSSSDSERIFGGECEYDVSVNITIKNEKVDTISVSYEAQSGTATAECRYYY